MLGSRRLHPASAVRFPDCSHVTGPGATAAGPCYFSSRCLFHDRKGSGKEGRGWEGGADVCQVIVPTLMCTELEIVGGGTFWGSGIVCLGEHTRRPSQSHKALGGEMKHT